MVLLVAAVRPTIRFVQNVFGDSAIIKSASRITLAHKLLREGADLVLCSVQFDESRMFDFLVAAKSDPKTRDTPFLCFRHLASALHPTIFKSLEIACRAEGSEFVDLADLRRELGVVGAEKRFREIVLSYASQSRAGRKTGHSAVLQLYP